MKLLVWLGTPGILQAIAWIVAVFLALAIEHSALARIGGAA